MKSQVSKRDDRRYASGRRNPRTRKTDKDRKKPSRCPVRAARSLDIRFADKKTVYFITMK